MPNEQLPVLSERLDGIATARILLTAGGEQLSWDGSSLLERQPMRSRHYLREHFFQRFSHAGTTITTRSSRGMHDAARQRFADVQALTR